MVAIVQCADIFCCHEGLGFDLAARHADLGPELLQTVGITIEQLAEMRAHFDTEIEEAEAVLGSSA